jgi:hypothetical protein
MKRRRRSKFAAITPSRRAAADAGANACEFVDKHEPSPDVRLIKVLRGMKRRRRSKFAAITPKPASCGGRERKRLRARRQAEPSPDVKLIKVLAACEFVDKHEPSLDVELIKGHAACEFVDEYEANLVVDHAVSARVTSRPRSAARPCMRGCSVLFTTIQGFSTRLRDRRTLRCETYHVVR